MSTQTRLSTLAINMVAALVIATPSAVYPLSAASKDSLVKIAQIENQDQILIQRETLPAASEQTKAMPNIVQTVMASAVQVEAAVLRSCALLGSGSVQCWGLGFNSTADSSVPVAVVGLQAGVTQISARTGNACALTNNGAVKCLGLNSHGELGNNSTADSSVPVDVVGLQSGVKAISAGGTHSCAILNSGAVKCWGDNFLGQLGNLSTVDSSVPVDVVGLQSDAIAISVNGYHTCAVLKGGAVKCWGANYDGQLGNNSRTHSRVPVDVFGLQSGVTAISVGESHSCALLNTGATRCWGKYRFGWLGTESGSLIPVAVAGLQSGVVAISAGRGHTCVILNGGGVKCWGYNFNGQLGDNSTSSSDNPRDVVGLQSGVTAISAGGYHTCALLSSGALKCWGSNEHGQLGNNTMTNSSVPVDVDGLGGNNVPAPPTPIAISPGDVCGYVFEERDQQGTPWWIFHDELNRENYFLSSCVGSIPNTCFTPSGIGYRELWPARSVSFSNLSPPRTSPSGISLNKWITRGEYNIRPIRVSQCNDTEIPATSIPVV